MALQCRYLLPVAACIAHNYSYAEREEKCCLTRVYAEYS
jgi:hypothetical protein